MKFKRFIHYFLAFSLFSPAAAFPAYGQTDVHILDVGQGLSVLVTSQENALLYDGGDAGHSSYVVSYLKQQDISSLDCVIASHYDGDHLNGVVGALNVFPTETLLGPDYTADSRVFRSFQEISAAKGLTPLQPVPGTEYSLGDATIQVLAPSSSDYSDVNNYSIAIRIQDGDTSFLITGDAENQSEQEMLSSGLTLDSDVYIMAHHGSGTSNSLEFLQAVSPEYAVVSCGLGNAHGHPHADALEAVNASGSSLLRTDLQGNLIASTDGHKITWNTEPCDDFTPGNALSAPLPKTEPKTESSQETKGSVRPASSGISRTPYDGYTILVNMKTQKYHVPGCRSVQAMKDANKGYCSDSSYLDANGYEPCKNCH